MAERSSRQQQTTTRFTDRYVLRGIAYAQAVIAGEIAACSWVRLACQRHLDDLDRWRTAGPYAFDESAAGQWCQFAELMPHIKGPLAGENIRLEDWQCFLLTAAFGWMRRGTKLRRFRRVYIEVPRGNAKSTISSAIGLKAAFADGEGGAEVYCLDPGTPVLMADLTWRPVGELKPGDVLVGLDEEPRSGQYRKLRPSTVIGSRPSTGDALRITFADGTHVICSQNHRWLARPPNGKADRWIEAGRLDDGWQIREIGSPWKSVDVAAEAYLAGVFDGEGYLHAPTAPRAAARVGFAQKPGTVLNHVISLLRSLGFRPTAPRMMAKSSAAQMEVRGLYESMRFLGQCRPLRLLEKAEKLWAGKAPARTGSRRIARIDPVRNRALVDIETTTGTFVAAGLFSHNSAAVTRDQARIVFAAAQQMARRRPDMCSALGVEVLAHAISQVSTASTFQPVASESNALDGLNVYLALIDELHAHRTRDVYDTLETGTGKRPQSMLWTITTAGSNRAGICYEIRTYATRVLNGVVSDDSFFGVIYSIDDGDDWTAESTWKKANPNYGVSVMPEVIAQLCAKAMEMPAAQASFKTKHLNVWVNADQAWMDMAKWRACTDPDLSPDDFAGEPCWVGLDLASKVDIASRALLFRRMQGETAHFYLFLRHFLPESAVQEARNSQYKGWEIDGWLTTTPGQVLDFAVVEADLAELSIRFQVQEIAYDPWQATQMASNMAAKGATMVEYRNTVANFSAPMKEIDALVRAGRLHIPADPVLEWMVSNVVCHIDAKDNIYPRKETVANKIDGVVAAIMALGRATAAPEVPVFTSSMSL